MRCYPIVREIGMPRKNRLLYSCVLLGITSCTLYEPLCLVVFCCKEASVSSLHFCGIVLVLCCDGTDLLK